MNQNDPKYKDILTRARALATMADPTRGGSPQEVETAARHLQKLFDQYNVSLLEVLNTASAPTEAFGSQSSNGLLGAVKPWHWALAGVIGRIMSTKHFATGGFGVTLREQHSGTKGEHAGHRMSFFGAQQSCEASCELFDMWVVELDRMAVKATAQYIREMTNDPGWQDLMEEQGVEQFRHIQGLGSAHPTVWRASWLMGLLAGIESVLAENEAQRKQIGTTTQARLTQHDGDPIVPLNNLHTGMVLFTRELQTAYTAYQKAQGMRTVSSSRTRLNIDAHSRGKAVGKQIRLTSKRIGE